MISQRDSNLEEKNTIMLNKKIRRIEEENIELKIKVDQLTGQIKLLNKEIYILKG